MSKLPVRCLAILLILALAAGCAQLPLAQPTPEPTATVVATQIPTPTAAPPTATPGPKVLRVWVPPQFDPNSGTQAAILLKARLDEFAARRPDVSLEVRVKAVDGPGGMLDSLVTTSAAAPQALPDLVALPRPLLEAAALKGLLHPSDDLSRVIDNPDWYEYARQMARLQNSTFGLPFAGDGMLLVYRPTVVNTAPVNLSDALETKQLLVFPAADHQAMVTLALYQAYGGTLLDDQGRPALDVDALTNVFTFYQSAIKSGSISTALTQLQTDDQAWETFSQYRSDLVLTWSSRYLSSRQADVSAVTMPVPGDVPFTMMTGWVWALAGSQSDHQALSVELAQFLCEGDFLAKWTDAAGMLPTRASALLAWKDVSLQSLALKLVLSASPYPSADVLSGLAPALQQATVEVIKQQSDARLAAQQAVASLASPK